MTEAVEEIIDQPEIIEEPAEIVEPEPQPEPEEEKVPKGAQKRIDQITREKYEERRARERADAELAAIKRELEQLKQKPPEPAKTLPNGAPDPDKYPAGRYDPDYLEAVTDYKVQQRFEAQQAQQQAAQRQQSIGAMEAKAQEAYPDYQEATQEFLNHPLARVPQFREILIDSENPAELSYFLGKNPQELDAISQMTPTQAIRYIGKLEAKISSTPTEPEKKPVSAAPKPIAPLVSAKTTVVTKDPAKMTMAEYAEYRRNQAK